MEPLRNPEAAWSRAVTPATIDRGEIERRIGPTSEPIEVLSGGFANLNVRVGDRVVRIIKRDPSSLAKELALLSQPWRALRTPRVLDRGSDFFVLEHLALRPLVLGAGAAVGRALAEIHARRYNETGILDAELALAQPFPPEGFVVDGYVRWNLRAAEPFLDAALVARVRAHADAIADEASAALDAPVLSHTDFKVSNLHLDGDGALVVLDWEFAWAGPRLLDVGQFLRWNPPEPFVHAFADAYRDGGGILVDGWRRVAAAIDLGNLLGLYARHPIMRSSDDIPRRIAEIAG